MVAKGDFIVEFPKKQKLQLKIYHAEVKDNQRFPELSNTIKHLSKLAFCLAKIIRFKSLKS